MYQKVSLTLTKTQVQKLMQGKPIQLTHSQLINGKHHLLVHPVTAKKIGGAIRRQKGVRITVSPHELEMSGEGLKEFWDKLKNAGKWIKDKVIDTPFYQQNIKPIVRQAVDAGVAVVAPRLGPGADLAKKGVYSLGEKTGAYGIKAKRGRPKQQFKLLDGMQTMLGPSAPAMNPTMPTLPAIGGSIVQCSHCGGSFRL